MSEEERSVEPARLEAGRQALTYATDSLDDCGAGV